MFLFTVLGILAIGNALPMSEEEITRAAMYNPDLFEGDITGVERDADRNAIVNPAHLWTNGEVPYIIDSSLNDYKEIILSAMETYHEKTCIRFVPKTSSHKNYIILKPVAGCTSPVGMNGGEQTVSLDQGCYHRQIVEHELGHAIGFWHEQSRSDRDEYLNIYWDNIIDGLKFNFDKLAPWLNNFLGENFDYDSIMLYDNHAFAKDYNLLTMEAKNGQPLLPAWEKEGLSASDIRRVNRLYECFDEKRPDPVDPPDFHCDFEEHMCGMTFLPEDKKWSREDITVGGKTSKAMVLTGNENSAAGLVTEWLKIGRARNNTCVQFNAYINGNDAHAIHVAVFEPGTATEQILKLETKSDDWQLLKVKADTTQDTVAVGFFGYAFGSQSTIAIDNVRLSVKPCE